MHSNDHAAQNVEEDASDRLILLDLATILGKEKYVWIVTTLLVAIASVTYFMLSPVSYTASVTFAQSKVDDEFVLRLLKSEQVKKDLIKMPAFYDLFSKVTHEEALRLLASMTKVIADKPSKTMTLSVTSPDANVSKKMVHAYIDTLRGLLKKILSADKRAKTQYLSRLITRLKSKIGTFREISLAVRATLLNSIRIDEKRYSQHRQGVFEKNNSDVEMPIHLAEKKRLLKQLEKGETARISVESTKDDFRATLLSILQKLEAEAYMDEVNSGYNYDFIDIPKHTKENRKLRTSLVAVVYGIFIGAIIAVVWHKIRRNFSSEQFALFKQAWKTGWL